MALPTIPSAVAGVVGKERPSPEWYRWWKAVGELIGGLDQSRIDDLETALAARVGTAFFTMAATPPAGALAMDGSAVLISTYSALATAIYCGDADNGTASWGYKATTNVSPSSNRSTSGTYIVLPNGAGEFLRGWDNGRGVDSGRTLWSYQSDAIRNITAAWAGMWSTNTTVSGAAGKTFSDNTRAANGTAAARYQIDFDASLVVPTAGENRPRNLVGLACIWYRGVA